MIKAIIFDCFGVLTKDWWKEFLSSLPEGESVQVAKDLNYQYDAGKISLEEFVRGVHEATGREPQPIEDIFRTPKPEKNTELLDYIRGLRSQNYKIGLLSNVGTNWVREHFLTEDEQQLFDEIVLSYDVGMIKPDPKIYQCIADKLEVQPQEAVFIDDSPRYATGAEAVGMKGILYTDFKKFKADLEKLLAI